MYHYFQVEGGEEAWKPVPLPMLPKKVAEVNPMFVTVLATNKLVTKETPREDKLALKYLGPMYIDLDSSDIQNCINDLKAFVRALETINVSLDMVRFFATGSKGFHIEMPIEMFIVNGKTPKDGVQYLPLIYKRIALEFTQDTFDWRVYSMGMGRMWRQPNVLRPNGKYKVPLTAAQVKDLTPTLASEIVCAPIALPTYKDPEPVLELAVMFDRAMQDITDKLKKSKQRRPIPKEVFARPIPSIELLMEGKGIVVDAGFNQIAMQLAIYAREAGLSEDSLVQKCEGLVTLHQSDGVRYNTPERRRAELHRMFQVIGDDPCYEYAAPAFRVLLTHPAPDLDGMPVDRASIQEDITQAESPREEVDHETGEITEFPAPDEFNDVAGGLEISKYGMFGDTEHGKKRLTSLSVGEDVHVLRSMETNKINAIDVPLLINGKKAGRHLLELDTFDSVGKFNKFAQRHGHAFQGTDAQVRAAFMRVIQKGQKSGKEVYIHSREGLALVNIPHHPDVRLQEPFLIWSDAKKVVMEPRVRDCGVTINFQGENDPRGVYRCDLSDAPKLSTWIAVPENKDTLRIALDNLFRCQRPDVIGNFIGWFTACFYKAIFQKLYNQFPILHINGAAGSGKSSMAQALAHFFYYNQDPRIMSPSSTVFALEQGATGSDSIPLIVDEYKPHRMNQDVREKLRLMFRDAYNARDIQRGGGNRENANFKALTTTTLTAPVMFIAEAIEDESALLERVVLLTVAPPPQSVAHTWAARFHSFQPQAKNFAIIGSYIASELVSVGYTTARLGEEFGPMYQTARNELMLTENDMRLGLPADLLRDKQAARERTVFNFTVAKFGLIKFQEIVEDIYGREMFGPIFADFHAQTYKRMKDLAPATVPEYLKVLNVLVDLSYLEETQVQVMRANHEYGFGTIGGMDTLELSPRAAYSRYRQYCKLTNETPLYSGGEAFTHSLKQAPSLIQIGEGQALKQVPGGTFVFNHDELKRLGLMEFKPDTRGGRR